MQKLTNYIAVLLLCVSVCGYPQLCYGEPIPVSAGIEPLFKIIQKLDANDILRPRIKHIDYLEEMKAACITGDVASGRRAEKKRSAHIERTKSKEVDFTFDDLFELSKIITSEIGASWYPIEWKMMVGEVVLNRVASPEYPDNIYDVIHQRGQYQNADTKYFEDLLPLEDCVEAAARLLRGERLIDDIRVVAQSGIERGVGTYAILNDTKTGAVVYLCYTNFPELYENSEVNYGDCNDTKIYIYQPDNDDRGGGRCLL